jgi:hypothetical protein
LIIKEEQPHKANCDCSHCNLKRCSSLTILDDFNKSKSKCNLYYIKPYSIHNLFQLNQMTYFQCSLFGYLLGLLTATISSEYMKEAQPALLYLVPFTLLPLVVMAYLKNDLNSMWNEPFLIDDSKNIKKSFLL